MGQVIIGFIQTRLSRNMALALAFIFIGVGVFLFVQPAHALTQEIMDAFIWAFGKLVQVVVGVLGTLLINLFYVLIAVANYNQFLASSAVTAGWVVVRDIVNMFFVLVLLAIAIGTILQRQQYHYAQALPKFLAAAVLVNFSKTIAGIFIDFAQVVMMTFVGAISGAAGGNLAALLGIPGLLKQVNPMRSGASNTNPEIVAFGGFFLAMMFVAIAIIVVGILIVMLVIRIVALWFLIILSPAAFFLMALPNDKGYSAKWWDQFINYLLVGPVTMFFLWLSLSVVASQSGNTDDATKISTATELGFDFRGFGSEYPTIGGDLLGQTGIATIGGIASYILGICMLMATLMAAQQLSSVGGNLAGAGAGYVKDWFAGKRGPLNPFRAARETFGGVMARREERRKERVKQRVERFDRAIGMAQQAPRELAKLGAKAAIEKNFLGARTARDTYRSEGVQRGLDTFTRFATFGMGGWGKRQEVRRDNKRKEQHKIIDDEKAAIGPVRAEIEQFESKAAQLSLSADKKRKTDPDGAQKDREHAQALMNKANEKRQAVEKGEMKVQQAQGKLVLDSVREGGFSIYKKAAKLLATGAMGGYPVPYAPSFFDEMGRKGAESQVTVENAQSSAVSESAKRFSGDSLAEIDAKIAGSIPGFERTIDKMGLIVAKLEKGGFEAHEIDGVRANLMGLGADQPTMKLFEAQVASKYPAQSLEILRDSEKMGDVIRRGQIDPEKFSENGMTQELLSKIREEGKFDTWIDKAGSALSKAMHERLEEEMDKMEADGKHIDAAGNYTEEYKDMLLDFSKFGGDGSAQDKKNMNERLHLDNSGNKATGYDADTDGNFLKEIVSNQTYAPAFAGLTEDTIKSDVFVDAMKNHATRSGVGAFRKAKTTSKKKTAAEKKTNAAYDYISRNNQIEDEIKKHVERLLSRE